MDRMPPSDDAFRNYHSDGRFVMIRGVSERYNQVMINNAIAPSTEIDIRSFRLT
jgi:hypothetical protein